MNIRENAVKNYNELKQNPYPGRGIIIGSDSTGENIYQIYWIMGRSSNSRNRIFEAEGNNFVKTRAFDEKKLEDPSLIIYYPAKNIEDIHIITNGDQTDTIFDFIKSGKTFEESLETREFEPDGPNFTPRISGIVTLADNNYLYKLSILKTLYNNDENPVRYFYKYKKDIPGFGHMITTYETDGNPIPSFTGEPLIVPIYDSIDKNLDQYWNALNEENKVSLLVKKINISNNNCEVKIINKLK